MENEITDVSPLPKPFDYTKRQMEALGTIVFYWRHEYEKTVHGPDTFYVFPAGSLDDMELIIGAPYVAAESLLSKNAHAARKTPQKCVRFCEWAAIVYSEISN